MCLVRCIVLIFCFYIFGIYALTCRSDGGPKESELKTIYTKCLKMQDGKNSSRDFGDHEWKENNRNQRHDSEGHMGNDRGGNDNNGNGRRGSDSKKSSLNDRMGGQNDRMGNQNNRMGNHDDRISGYDDRFDSYDAMGGRENRMGNSGSGSRREDSMGNSRHERDELNGRNDFQHDFGNNFAGQYGYQSTQRYKRERKEENSGKRSQFNPNPKRYQDSNRSDDRTSEKNTSKDDEKKACALHCFLENLEMTAAEDGLPDRYLVTHALTKDVNNEDLKDFLQESIEECFQILDNENSEDKCEFSKNLLLCLSEKGRENCDDWKDDLKF